MNKDIYQSLKSSNQLLTDKKAFIESPADHPMRGTANWFALEVTEETDAAPASSNGTSDEQTHAEDGLGQSVQSRNWRVREFFVPKHGEEAKHDREEFGYAWERLEVECDVGTKTRSIVRVEEST